MNTLHLCCLVLLCFSCFKSQAVELIKHNGIDQSLDEQKYYFPSVLQLAIDKSADKYGPAQRQIVDLPMKNNVNLSV